MAGARFGSAAGTGVVLLVGERSMQPVVEVIADKLVDIGSPGEGRCLSLAAAACHGELPRKLYAFAIGKKPHRPGLFCNANQTSCRIGVI